MKIKARLKTCESVVWQGISAVGVLPSQLQAWCYSKNSKSISSRQKHFGRRRGKRQSLRQLASRPSSALETETNIWTCPWQQSGSQCWTQRRWYGVLLSGWKSGGHLQHDLEVPQVKAGETVPRYSTLQSGRKQARETTQGLQQKERFAKHCPVEAERTDPEVNAAFQDFMAGNITQDAQIMKLLPWE